MTLPVTLSEYLTRAPGSLGYGAAAAASKRAVPCLLKDGQGFAGLGDNGGRGPHVSGSTSCRGDGSTCGGDSGGSSSNRDSNGGERLGGPGATDTYSGEARTCVGPSFYVRVGAPLAAAGVQTAVVGHRGSAVADRRGCVPRWRRCWLQSVVGRCGRWCARGDEEVGVVGATRGCVRKEEWRVRLGWARVSVLDSYWASRRLPLSSERAGKLWASDSRRGQTKHAVVLSSPHAVHVQNHSAATFSLKYNYKHDPHTSTHIFLNDHKTGP